MNTSSRVIAYSLYGTDLKYLVGAVANVDGAAQFHPGWKCRFYYRADVPPATLGQLAVRGAELVPREARWFGEEMFWRFHAIDDPCVDYAMIRDTDSRFCFREQLAVFVWLRSQRKFHVMRDHPAHNLAIPGGTWGAQFGVVKGMQELIEFWRRTSKRYLEQAERKQDYGLDQFFLAEVVWPIVKNQALQHDEFSRTKWHADPWPCPVAADGKFVGEVFDENNQPRYVDRESRHL